MDDTFDDDAQAAKPKDDKRNKLAELAARKRKEQEEAAALEEARKKKPKKQQVAIDFGDSDEDEDYLATAAAEPDEEERPAPRPELEEEDERALMATQADRDFIDDTGLTEEERIDYVDDAEQLAQLEQAQEALEEGEEDELDKVFNKAKRKQDSGRNEAEDKRRVDSFLASMEVAIEQDFREYEAGNPAVHKLRMLPQLEAVVATKRLHNELLDAGLLGILKAFLEPMSDGTLPNVKLRETVLRLLHELPVDCSKEDRKDQLKRSGLGKMVMFLYKLPDETTANRRLAKDLIEGWSRPILAHGRRELDAQEESRILEARRLRQARQAEEPGNIEPELDEDGRPVIPRKGEPGFRWHAAIPHAAPLDYVRRPQAQASMPESKSRGGKSGERKISKRLATMGKGGKSLRAAHVSVEGRNVMVRD